MLTASAAIGFLFTTWWTALAVGAAAASIPIIIHLLNRRRFKVVVWAAMRFLLAAEKQNTRRMRLEQIVLLAVRATLLLLIVLAMASVMPWAESLWAYFWPDGAGHSAPHTGRAHKILVLDGSLSMAVKRQGQEQSAFERARAGAAVQIIKDSPSGDGFSIILMAGSPRRLGIKPSQHKDNLIREIEEKLKSHPHGNADVPATLGLVTRMLSESAGKFETSEVYFITDLQLATWVPGKTPRAAEPSNSDNPTGIKEAGDGVSPLKKIQDAALTVFVDVGQDGVDNLAVTDLQIDRPFVTAGLPTRVLVKVKNYGMRARTGVRVDLSISRARRTGQDPPFAEDPPPHPCKPFDLKENDEITCEFFESFREPGEYAIRARLTPDDLGPDNARAVIVMVKKNIPVLVVNGKTADDPFEGAAEYLSKALNPVLEGPVAPEIARQFPLRPRVVTEAQFGDLTEQQLDDYDCIFLCDVARLDSTETRRLKAHLLRGGGVIFCLGPGTSPHLDLYNKLLFENGRGVLPARLTQVQLAPDDHYFAFDLSKANFQEPPLKAFDSEDGKLALGSARFREYVRAKVPTGREVHSILSFLPGRQDPKKKVDPGMPYGDPAILVWQPVIASAPEPGQGDRDKKEQATAGDAALTRRQVSLYRGRVGLVTSTLNMSWTSWPASPSYLPMMQELLRVAIAGRMREQAAAVGDVLEEHLQSVGEKNAVVRIPGQVPRNARTQLTEDASVFRWSETDTSGIYRVTFGDDPREHLFAVNVPASGAGQQASESDFTKPRCTEALLKSIYAGSNLQVIQNPDDVSRKLGPNASAAIENAGPSVKGKIGPAIARWLLLTVLVLLLVEVVLAWKLGHHSAASTTGGSPPASGRLFPASIAVTAGVACLLVFGLLFLAARNDNTLRFLPESVHDFLENQLDVPPAAEGEANTLKLDYASYLRSIPLPGFRGLGEDEGWLIGAILLAAAVMVLTIYLREGQTAGKSYKVLLAGLRLSLIALTMIVLLPQLQLRSERRGWPNLVILIDDSQSMGEPDNYQDPEIRGAADKLTALLKAHYRKLLPAKIGHLHKRLEETNKQLGELQAALAGRPADEPAAQKRDRLRDRAENLARHVIRLEAQHAVFEEPTWQPGRLELVQALLTLQEKNWIAALVKERKVKVHLYHLDRGGQVASLAEVGGSGESGQLQAAEDKVWELAPEARTSPLGAAVHKVLDDFGTSSLAAVVALTDGITVESKDSDKKEDLRQVARYANVKGVPLFFVALGDAHGLRDVRLLSLDVPDQVHVNDIINFEAVVKGFQKARIPIKLYEKLADGKLVELKESVVEIDDKSQRAQLRYQPREAGDKVYVVRLEVPLPKDGKPAARADYLQLQRKIRVEAAQRIKVLYIEGQPRYEYRYLKSLLERESEEDRANKTIDLKVALLDADEDYSKEDKTALQILPARKAELFLYDVIVLGDVDPQHPKLKDHLQDLTDFVLERGGGLLFIAGSDFNPHALRDTPLAKILPVEPERARPGADGDYVTGFKPSLTPEGLQQPLFRFSADEADNLKIWNHLAPIFWYARGYKPKPAARVLAVHPADKQPLVVHQFAGPGRTLFFGFDETWRWRFREDELRYNQLWIQTMRYLASVRSTRPELRLSKQTPYTRGEIIKVTVRFPDSVPAQDLKEQIAVTWKRTPPAKGGRIPPPDTPQTLKLAKQEGARAVYEGWVSRTREGKYLFELDLPDGSKGLKLTAECEVRPPEQEMERLSTDLAGITKAVEIQAAIGIPAKVYTLDKAKSLLADIPEGIRARLDNPRPPVLVWNYVLVFLLVLFILTSEWILRKRKHLL